MSAPGAEKQKSSYTPMNDSFYDAADEVGYDLTPDSGVHESLASLDPEQRAKQEEEWREQLAKTEDEILTLRQVLAAKVKESQELKRKLGITVWREFRQDLDEGIKTVRDTDVYQKTETVVKSAAEKTSTVFGTIGASVSKKLDDVKNSTTYKSLEEKVGTAYTNVKEKVSGNRNSVQEFEEALEASEPRTNSTSAVAENKTAPK